MLFFDFAIAKVDIALSNLSSNEMAQMYGEVKAEQLGFSAAEPAYFIRENQVYQLWRQNVVEPERRASKAVKTYGYG